MCSPNTSEVTQSLNCTAWWNVVKTAYLHRPTAGELACDYWLVSVYWDLVHGAGFFIPNQQWLVQRFKTRYRHKWVKWMQLPRGPPPLWRTPKRASHTQKQAVRSRESRAVGWLSFISLEATSQYQTYYQIGQTLWSQVHF